MKSRITAALAAAVLAAAPLSAQAPWQETFKLDSLRANDPFIQVHTGSSDFWSYSSPYWGSLAPLSDPGNFDPVLVWCVDEYHGSHYNAAYLAWITPLDQNDYSHTRLGSSSAPEYQWAAYLAGSMNLDWTVATNRSNSVTLQDVMWAILGEGANASTRVSSFKTSTLAGTLGISAATDFSKAPSLNGFDAGLWGLITCTPRPGQPVSSCAGQEFLVQLPGVPKEVTPEPASLSLLAGGLAGVLGFRKRRRKAA